MKHPTDPVNVRITWCRRQSALARTEHELDGWRAEEDGLRDALLNRDHTNDYRLSDPEVFERYVLGFQDGRALLRITLAERLVHARLRRNSATGYTHETGRSSSRGGMSDELPTM
jgi:hypothetical protein